MTQKSQEHETDCQERRSAPQGGAGGSGGEEEVKAAGVGGEEDVGVLGLQVEQRMESRWRAGGRSEGWTVLTDSAIR